MKVIAVIPARYNSSRFPGKPIALIQKKPMIQWVYERVAKTRGLDEVIVATDDVRIEQAVRDFGGRSMMTGECVSGTDRVAQVAKRVDADIIVNVQGDEPLIEPAEIEAALELVASGRFEIGSVITKIKSEDEIRDPAVVKAITDKSGKAIYFSRFPIPYSRSQSSQGQFCAYRHLGLYVYTREMLMTLNELPASDLELGESLEQLRALEHGIAIGLAEVESTAVGVDTPEDLVRIQKLIEESGLAE